MRDAAKKPLISVVTVTWNCRDVIRDCLDSVASQQYEPYEHVVIDGASSDGTVEILRPRFDEIEMLSEPDGGIYDAFNKGLRKAKGDIVGFLGADDTFATPHSLAHIAAAFENPAVNAVYGDLEYVARDEVGKVVRHWRSQPFKPWLLRMGWMPPHPTLYVRRELYDRIGGFDTRYRIAADYHAILQLFRQQDIAPSYIPEVLVRMRTGGVSNCSFKSILQKSREDLDALRRTGVGGLGALAMKNLSKLGQIQVG